MTEREREEILQRWGEEDCACLARVYEDIPRLLEALELCERKLEEARRALTEIATAKVRWVENVGSYAGGETFSGFALRLQAMARGALSGGGPETTPERDSLLCSDCPPVGYPTDKTRCDSCPIGGGPEITLLGAADRNLNISIEADDEVERLTHELTSSNTNNLKLMSMLEDEKQRAEKAEARVPQTLVTLPGTYIRCMSGHYYGCTRGDEECPICAQIAKLTGELAVASERVEKLIGMLGNVQERAEKAEADLHLRPLNPSAVFTGFLQDQVALLKERNAKLTGERDAAKLDTARLDWLRDNRLFYDSDHCWKPSMYEYAWKLPGDDFREAIDAAIAKEPA